MSNKSQQSELEEILKQTIKKFNKQMKICNDELQKVIDLIWNCKDTEIIDLRDRFFPDGKPQKEEFLSKFEQISWLHMKNFQKECNILESDTNTVNRRS